ncbi:YfiR family protein [Rhizorhabdus histidinilytica]|uniref:YfiR family protein n=1 Tax=Rhizorhabdus histidinilytica TaxID=439228 RepID=UPI001AD9AA6F|nr:YfiR family protein [Rhizorhabdus histidinilytica]
MRRCFRSIVGAMVAVYAGAGPAAPLEQAIKASYVTKFAPFVEWPAVAFAGPGSPFLICLSGRDSFGPVIDDLARGQRVRGRPVQVRRVADAASAGDCQILVIGAGTDGALVEGAGKSMLTISDKSAGVDGGMIRFVRQGGRIRFEIDNGAARAAHLTISSKLLELAVTVNP